MARIFSIEFTFNGTIQHAMITVRQTPFHAEYKIVLQSIELTNFLLSDKIISPRPGVFLFANISEADYNEPMKQILAAVSERAHSLLQ